MVSLEVVVKHLNAHHALLDYSPAHWLQAMVTKMTKKNSPHENSRPAYIDVNSRPAYIVDTP